MTSGTMPPMERLCTRPDDGGEARAPASTSERPTSCPWRRRSHHGLCLSLCGIRFRPLLLSVRRREPRRGLISGDAEGKSPQSRSLLLQVDKAVAASLLPIDLDELL